MTPPPIPADPSPQPQWDGDMPEAPAAEPEKSDMRREIGEVDGSRKALVKRWQGLVKAGKARWDKDFKQMRKDLKFLSGDQWESDPGKFSDAYRANITQRHVQQRVAALYAKNPTVVCKRRQTLDFKIWDETAAALMQIQTAVQQTAMAGAQQQATGMVGLAPPPVMPPEIQALLQDVIQGTERRKLLDKVARTLEVIFRYTLAEQNPPFKTQMKQLVRRTLATSVGYVKLGYQRALQKRPEDVERITDITQRIAQIEQILADIQDAELTEEHAEHCQLKLELADLQAKPDIVLSEGLVFDFPKSTAIIPDPRCTQLHGFLGAQWVAQEYLLTCDDVKQIYKVDLGSNFTAWVDEHGKTPEIEPEPESGDAKKRGRVCVWEIYSKTDGLCYVVADGYEDFLSEPTAPAVELSRFWPIFTLTFNETEHDCDLFPPSDVSLARPMQVEYNRSRQSLREHRASNRPRLVTGKGKLDQEDIDKLNAHPGGVALTELNTLANGEKAGDVLQPLQMPVIDPALYDTAHLFEDFQRVLGSSEANLGGTSGATATENSIAEGSRTAGIASNIDDLDDLLNEMCRAGGQVLLKEYSAETAQMIAGPGAAWPELTRADVMRELYLEIEAGSSGRPNQAAEVSKIERLMPALVQLPGITPDWIAKLVIRALDANVDLTDALTSGAQSIVAMNAQKQVATGDPATDPASQGPQGSSQVAQAQAGVPQGPSPMERDTGAPQQFQGAA